MTFPVVAPVGTVVLDNRLEWNQEWFAALALALAAIGLYSVISLALAPDAGNRNRIAIGARPGDVARLVLRERVRPVLAGLALGLAMAMNRVLVTLLYEVAPSDPVVLATSRRARYCRVSVWVCSAARGHCV